MSAEVLDYPIHDVALMFPPMVAPEERQALKDHIEVYGVEVPLDIWEDSKGQRWIVNGRTRRDLTKELVDEGKITLDSQFLKINLVGSMPEADMIAKVAGMQILHRHMSASQRAVMAVKMVNMERSATKDKPIKAGKDPKKPNADLERLAKEFGVSRAYAYDAAKLSTAGKKLFESVGAGDISLPVAMGQLKEKLQTKAKPEATAETAQAPEGSAASPDANGATHTSTPSDNGAVGESAGAEPEAKPELALDGENKPVAEEWVETFGKRPVIVELIKETNALAKRIADVVKSPAGVRMDAQEITASVKLITGMLKHHQPHIVCPNCKGECKVADEGTTPTGKPKSRKCPVCGGHGWIDELQNKLFKSGKVATPELETADA